MRFVMAKLAGGELVPGAAVEVSDVENVVVTEADVMALLRRVDEIVKAAEPLALINVIDEAEFDQRWPEFKGEKNNQRIRYVLEDRLREVLFPKIYVKHAPHMESQDDD